MIRCVFLLISAACHSPTRVGEVPSNLCTGTGQNADGTGPFFSDVRDVDLLPVRHEEYSDPQRTLLKSAWEAEWQDGRLQELAEDWDGDGMPEVRTVRVYDADGHEVAKDVEAFGYADSFGTGWYSRQVSTYDGDRLATEKFDYAGDGTVDRDSTFTYDPLYRLKSVRDVFLEGFVGTVERSYLDDASLNHDEIQDINGDAIVDRSYLRSYGAADLIETEEYTEIAGVVVNEGIRSWRWDQEGRLLGFFEDAVDGTDTASQHAYNDRGLPVEYHFQLDDDGDGIFTFWVYQVESWHCDGQVAESAPPDPVAVP